MPKKIYAAILLTFVFFVARSACASSLDLAQISDFGWARLPSTTFSTSPRKIVAVEVSISLAKSKPRLNEPVILVFSFKNNSNKVVQIDLGANGKHAFRFSMQYPDGQIVTLPRIPEPEFTVSGIVRIAPGGEYSQKLVLNEWTKMPVDGKYTLSSALATSGTNLKLQFPTFTFVIAGSDPQSLERVADDLLNTIYREGGVEERSLAATALTFVTDDIGKNRLLRAIDSNRGVENAIIDSLIRQQSEFSVTVLMSFSTRASLEIRRKAVAALRLIEHRTTNDHLKQRIRSHLQPK